MPQNYTRCWLKNLNVESEDETVEINRTNYVNIEQEVVDIRLSNMSFIPNQIFQIFPNLIILKSLSSKKQRYSLKSLKQEHIKGGDKLEILSIQFANFSRINESVLSELPSLRLLDLSSNLIQEIDDKAFAGNPKLTMINLSGNLIEQIPEKLFEGFGELQEIYLCQNRLQQLDDSIFSRNLNLKTVILKNNLIDSPSTNVFKNLKNLEEIDLGFNKIQEINGIFSENHNLKIMNLTSNLISKIPAKFFKNLSELEEVHMGGNNLTILDFDVGDNKKLAKLSFSENPIDQIDSRIFEEKPSLKFVDLTGAACFSSTVRLRNQEEGELKKFQENLGRCGIKVPVASAGIDLKLLMIYLAVMSIFVIGGFIVYFPVARLVKRIREVEKMDTQPGEDKFNKNINEISPQLVKDWDRFEGTRGDQIKDQQKCVSHLQNRSKSFSEEIEITGNSETS